AIAFLDILLRLKDSIRGMMDSLSGWNKEAKEEFEGRTKQLETMVHQVDQLANAQASASGAGQSGVQRTESQIKAQKELNDQLQARFVLLSSLSDAIEKVKEHPSVSSAQLAGAAGADISGAGDANQQQTVAFNAELQKQNQLVG